jgi:hypothetical protein
MRSFGWNAPRSWPPSSSRLSNLPRWCQVSWNCHKMIRLSYWKQVSEIEHVGIFIPICSKYSTLPLYQPEWLCCGFWFLAGAKNIELVTKESSVSLGPPQSPIQWVLVGYFHRAKLDGEWSWPLTPFSTNLRIMELHFHSSICHHGKDRENFTFTHLDVHLENKVGLTEIASIY